MHECEGFCVFGKDGDEGNFCRTRQDKPDKIPCLDWFDFDTYNAGVRACAHGDRRRLPKDLPEDRWKFWYRGYDYTRASLSGKYGKFEGETRSHREIIQDYTDEVLACPCPPGCVR